jgi:hypothetical protein
MAAAMACPMVRPTKNAASQIARELTLSQGMPRLPLQAATLWKLCPRSLPEARRLCSLVRARQLFLPPWRGCRTPRLRVDAHANHLSDFWQNEPKVPYTGDMPAGRNAVALRKAMVCNAIAVPCRWIGANQSVQPTTSLGGHRQPTGRR